MFFFTEMNRLHLQEQWHFAWQPLSSVYEWMNVNCKNTLVGGRYTNHLKALYKHKVIYHLFMQWSEN